MQTPLASNTKQSRFSWPVKLLAIGTLGLTIASVSIPNLLRSRIASNEASAMGSVRTLNTALESYASHHPGEGYPQRLADLEGYIDPVLAKGEKSGYSFRYEPRQDADGVARSFKVDARPQKPQTGQRRFSSTENGVIHYQTSPAQRAQPLNGGSPQQAQGVPLPEMRRILRKGAMSVIVADPAAMADKVRSIAGRLGGYVESVRLSDEGTGVKQTAISIRVPVARLDEARREVRALGERVQNEQDDARDVTGQYVDLESNLRNFRAEEAQYLEIMRRAGSIKDTLSVAERLADVRGRIERTEGQLNLLAHQTETALLEVTLCTETVVQPVNVRWHPRAEMKAAFSQAKDDLATYVNFMVAVILRLPGFAMWALTALLAALGAWRLARWVRKMFVPSSVTL